jgi:peptide deformylase
MSVFSIIKYPDPALKQVSEPVSEFDDALREFVSQLNETMMNGPGGVGIAAPQVGHFMRIVIVDVSSKKNTPSHGHLVLINPEITKWEGMQKGREGCMSVPDFTGNVIRAEHINLTAYNVFGELQQYNM